VPLSADVITAFHQLGLRALAEEDRLLGSRMDRAWAEHRFQRDQHHGLVDERPLVYLVYRAALEFPVEVRWEPSYPATPGCHPDLALLAGDDGHVAAAMEAKSFDATASRSIRARRVDQMRADVARLNAGTGERDIRTFILVFWRAAGEAGGETALRDVARQLEGRFTPSWQGQFSSRCCTGPGTWTDMAVGMTLIETGAPRIERAGPNAPPSPSAPAHRVPGIGPRPLAASLPSPLAVWPVGGGPAGGRARSAAATGRGTIRLAPRLSGADGARHTRRRDRRRAWPRPGRPPAGDSPGAREPGTGRGRTARGAAGRSCSAA
jgi:hypothetical protein